MHMRKGIEAQQILETYISNDHELSEQYINNVTRIA